MLKSKLCMGICILFAFSASVCAEQYRYEDNEARDPFVPLISADGRLRMMKKTERAEEAENETNLAIEGIIYDKYGISYAIINDSVVKTGDTVGDFIVLEIQKDKVVFIREGQTTEVVFKKEEL